MSLFHQQDGGAPARKKDHYLSEMFTTGQNRKFSSLVAESLPKNVYYCDDIESKRGRVRQQQQPRFSGELLQERMSDRASSHSSVSSNDDNDFIEEEKKAPPRRRPSHSSDS